MIYSLCNPLWFYRQCNIQCTIMYKAWILPAGFLQIKEKGIIRFLVALSELHGDVYDLFKGEKGGYSRLTAGGKLR